MSRLIDADKFKEKFIGQYEFMKRVIDDEPTAAAVHGKWIQQKYVYDIILCCSNCGYSGVGACGNYCRECGAKMDLK